MAVLQLSLLLVPYAVVVAIFLLLAFFNVFHLIHYGATTRTSFLFTSAFIVGTVLIASLTWWALGGVDWSREVTFEFLNAATPVSGTEFGI